MLPSSERQDQFTIVSLLEAVRREAVKRIHNGETTERALAQRIGLSQPQMHHVLKRARTLKPEVADLLIAQLGISVASLSIGVG